MRGLVTNEGKMNYCQEIIDLENNRHLREAAALSYGIWKETASNQDLLNSALELWYVLFNDVKLGLDIPCDDELYGYWDEVSSALKSCRDKDPELLFYSGYMMMIGFYLFAETVDEVEEDHISDFGVLLMEKAYNLDPSDPVFALQHIRNEYEDKDMKKCSSESDKIMGKHRQDIQARFSGGGMINDYFSAIFLD